MTPQQLKQVVSSVNSDPALSSLTSNRLFLAALTDAGILECELGLAWQGLPNRDSEYNHDDWYWTPTARCSLVQYGHTGRFSLICKEE